MAAAAKAPSVKTLAENPNLTRIPPAYTFQTTPRDDQAMLDLENAIVGQEPIPVIDLSLLTSGTPEQRSRVVRDIGCACKEWGFLMVINHGVDEGLMKRMLEGCVDFFDLTEEEKMKYEGKHVLDPVRFGTSFNASVDEVLFWRDHLKVIVHPKFHSPSEPAGFSKVLEEYTTAVRRLVRELLGGISESLGLESDYIDKTLNIESSLQILVANLYPPCPEPELAIGLPPHSDHGLLTMLIQNEIGGLQVEHKGRWVNVGGVPNTLLVVAGDHVEILSNGKYRSLIHRAVVNNKTARVSIAVFNGPSPEAIVSPAVELLEHGSSPPAYMGMKYRDYLELQQSNQLSGKSCFDRVKI